MGTEHIVTSFDEDLGQLETMISEMGGMAEAQLSDAIKALVNGDAVLAARTITRDKDLDDFESEIGALAVRLLALRNPVANDLRIVIAVLKISSNLERVGDYAKNIAKRTMVLERGPKIGDAVHSLVRMAGLTQAMIKNVLDSFASGDSAKADDVRLRDEDVDRLYTSLFRELLTYMMEDPRNITPCTHLLFMAKNLERIGDHATGIAEQVHFMVLGETPPDERPKGDGSSMIVSRPKKSSKKESE
jgi:phosphate transport system protein